MSVLDEAAERNRLWERQKWTCLQCVHCVKGQTAMHCSKYAMSYCIDARDDEDECGKDAKGFE